MSKVTFEELLEAGVHFGHMRSKWNPAMAPYIFGEKNGVHIIDLHKTVTKLEEAAAAMNQIAKSGKRVLFVATKKQAREVMESRVKPLGVPLITERWSGGMLTNFATIRRTIKKMQTIDKMFQDGTAETMSKRERLQLSRQRDKMELVFGSIVEMTKIPSALFVVDIRREHLAVKEATKLGIPIFAMVDTNANPNLVDFAIPANDDAASSIDKIMQVVTDAYAEGMAARKAAHAKDKEQAEQHAIEQAKPKKAHKVEHSEDAE
jgi:small subunit ribosomal protein S2